MHHFRTDDGRRTNDDRDFFSIFFKFSQVFRSFRTCSDLFGPVRTCSDLFGPMEDGRTAFRRPRPQTARVPRRFKKKLAPGQSVAKMKDQVMTIQTVQESSKSELSSGTFGHFKVCNFCPNQKLMRWRGSSKETNGTLPNGMECSEFGTGDDTE